MSMYMITIDEKEHKGKAKILNTENNKECVVQITHGTQKYNKDTQYIEINTEQLEDEKKKSPVDLFEEQLELSEEQRQKLFQSWGHTKAIMIKDVSEELNISRDTAIGIITLAKKYGLLTRGHNNTWKVIDDTVQKRWKEAAIALERGGVVQKGITRTPTESIELLALNSTEEEKRKARGEGGMISSVSSVSKDEGMLPKKRIVKNSKNIVENPVTIIDDSQQFSGVTEAKKREREEWEKNNAKISEEYKSQVNVEGKAIRSKCVTLIQKGSTILQKKNK